MAKVTIDTLPEKSVEYLRQIPNQIENPPFEGSHRVYSALVNKPMIFSEIETLVGQFFSNQSFATFQEPSKMDCPETFSQALVPNIDIEKILEKLLTVHVDSFNEQEELEQLNAFFKDLQELESLYQKIIGMIRNLQKG
ncbi:MAG: hypothetical protein EBU93_01135 [Chlamydiae bacterium]|nr:hypothetical protein [Chlamydiota bacterium]